MNMQIIEYIIPQRSDNVKLEQGNSWLELFPANRRQHILSLFDEAVNAGAQTPNRVLTSVLNSEMAIEESKKELRQLFNAIRYNERAALDFALSILEGSMNESA